jgi:hypothetical protein
MENNVPDVQQQAPIVTSQPAPFDPTKQGKSKKSILIAIFALIILIIILASFIVYNNNGNPIPTVTPGIKTPVITPVPTIPSATPIKMTLTKGKVVTIPTTDITIEYVGSTLPNPKCFDCVSSTDIAVVKNDIRKILSYSCGGIAGKCIDSYKEFDIEILLENATETTASVKITK